MRRTAPVLAIVAMLTPTLALAEYGDNSTRGYRDGVPGTMDYEESSSWDDHFNSWFGSGDYSTKDSQNAGAQDRWTATDGGQGWGGRGRPD